MPLTRFLKYCLPIQVSNKITSGHYVERRVLNYALVSTPFDSILHSICDSVSIDGGNLDVRTWQFGKLCSRWALRGFPDGRDTYAFLHTIYCIILEALMPMVGKTAKTSKMTTISMKPNNFSIKMTNSL